MASYNRQMRRAMARGKRPEQITIKERPGNWALNTFGRVDETINCFRGHNPLCPGVFNNGLKGGGKV